MIIENSQVSLYSKTQFSFKHSQSTSIQFHYGEKSATNKSDSSILSLQESLFSITQSTRAVYNYEDNLTPEDRIKKIILEILFGRLNDNKTQTTLYPNKKSNVLNNNSLNSTNPYKVGQLNEKELKAIVYDTQEQYYQKQAIEFSSSVKIQTPTQSFEMSLNLSFSQEFYESHNTQMIIGDKSFIDPLVINYDEDVNPFANISNLHFAFDLDSDGKDELIPYLKAGAGYLVLDKNLNGKIDSGKELFGPQTGDGFKELAKGDGGKNGFIDEADEVFSKLKIWSFDEAGNSSLISLLDANVGAIYLSDVQSGFNYKDGINSTLAQQQGNGVFIKEDGSGLGVVNSINIVV